MISMGNLSRIGGELLFPTLDSLTSTQFVLPPKYQSQDCVWTDTGRSALLLAAMTISRHGGTGRVWLPAFSCASIEQAFIQANYVVQYYSVSPCIATERPVAVQPTKGDVLLFIHYLGHYNSAMTTLAQSYRDAGIWIIEDCVQYSLASSPPKYSHFLVSSFRKILPVADGATLVGDGSVSLKNIQQKLECSNEAFVSSRVLGKLMRGVNVAPTEYLCLFKYSEDLLSNEITPRQTSWLSRWMLPRIDWNLVVSRRRKNWLAMFDGLRRTNLLSRVTPVFGELKAEDIPLGFLVKVADGRRDALRSFLADKNIFCAVHWPLNHLPADDAFERDRSFGDSVLTLPIDQTMFADQVNQVVDMVILFFQKTAK